MAAIELLKRRGAKDLRFVCLLAAPEGIRNPARGAFPTCRSGRRQSTKPLDEFTSLYHPRPRGDAGDRIFGRRGDGSKSGLIHIGSRTLAGKGFLHSSFLGRFLINYGARWVYHA